MRSLLFCLLWVHLEESRRLVTSPAFLYKGRRMTQSSSKFPPDEQKRVKKGISKHVSLPCELSGDTYLSSWSEIVNLSITWRALVPFKCACFHSSPIDPTSICRSAASSVYLMPTTATDDTSTLTTTVSRSSPVVWVLVLLPGLQGFTYSFKGSQSVSGKGSAISDIWLTRRSGWRCLK